MEKEKTFKFLLRVEADYPNSGFKAKESIIEAWHDVFKDYAPEQVWNSYKQYRAKGNDFPPNLGHIENALLMIQNQQQESSAEEAWAKLYKGKVRRSEISDIGAKAWELWGGRERWKLLPDIKYAENARQAEQAISFARKEYIKLYTDLMTKQINHQATSAIGHNQAKNSLDAITKQATLLNEQN